jgi:hypothetical protein
VIVRADPDAVGEVAHHERAQIVLVLAPTEVEERSRQADFDTHDVARHPCAQVERHTGEATAVHRLGDQLARQQDDRVAQVRRRVIDVRDVMTRRARRIIVERQ